MRIIFTIFLSVAAIALFASLQCAAKANLPPSIEASPYLIERVKNNDWMLIDVRPEEDFKQGHIPGAINMPHENIEAYLSELNIHKDKPIIVYCQSGKKATLAIKMLQDLDFPDVLHLEGDMLGWNASRLPVERM